MNSPETDYKYFKTITGIDDIAYNTIFEKYIIENLRGNEKKIEIDSTDQETLITKLNGGYPIPGMMYTFIYPPKKGENVKIEIKGKEKEYVDFVPLVFCINNRKLNFSGINLNVLPSSERLKFLQSFYDLYEPFFADVELLTENNKLAINRKFIRLVKSGKGQKLIKEFSRRVNANFNYGYRSYKMERVDRLRMVEFCEWSYIPFYDPKNAFKMMNQAQIHSLYWKFKNTNQRIR